MNAINFSGRLATFVAILFTALLAACSGQRDAVIEIATFKLKQGVTADEFRPLDKAVESQLVAKQPGFISRESAAGDNGEWLVVVHWRSVEDAEASMASFSGAPAAEQFMSKIDANTMSMKRYISNR